MKIVGIGGGFVCSPGQWCVPAGAKFSVAVDMVTVPAGGYVLAQSYIVVPEALTYNPTSYAADEFVWPDCNTSVALRNNVIASSWLHGCTTGVLPPLPVSNYSGSFIELSMTCSATASGGSLRLLPHGDPVALTNGSVYALADGTQVVPWTADLTVNCQNPATATPTPTNTLTSTPTNTPTPCMADGQVDSDCDLMPDKWEQSFDQCVNPNSPDAGLDPDFDGKANLLEYAKGSNPCSGDTDGDGLADGVDSCQLLPEDFDGYQDADGCPDTDNDSDGILDAADGCPNVPESFDAFKDTDGCPDPDNDEDGFPDVADDCPGTDYTAGPDGVADTGDEPLDALGVPIQTKEDYDGVLDGDGCHDSPEDDYDGDGLADNAEAFIFFTDPSDPDTDGDGCSDGREVSTDVSQGGQRDPLNRWDFYDVAGFGGGPPDGVIDLPNDVFGVIQHYSPGGVGPYDAVFDRGPSIGPHGWNMSAPDGQIDLPNDIMGVILQYINDCR